MEFHINRSYTIVTSQWSEREDREKLSQSNWNDTTAGKNLNPLCVHAVLPKALG